MKKQPSSEANVAEIYLTMRGWRRKAWSSPWCWYKAPLRGTFYKTKDAYEVQMSLDKPETRRRSS